ncbi:hypothetical protein MASR2M12_03070 [Bacteroidales bacterium]
MNLIKPLTILTFVLIALFTSCNKDKNNPETVSGPFVATIDGQSFPATSTTLTKAKYVSSTKMLQIIGQPADQKEAIILSLFPFGSDFSGWNTGTYNFNPANVTNLKYLLSAEYNRWEGQGYQQWFMKWEHVQTGELVIESISDTKIKGRFHFDAVKMLSNGTFDPTSVKKVTAGAFDLDIVNY